jgi:hypothetical protein
MELKFYLWDNNAEVGPYSLSQIRSIYASGRITLDTLLREESDTEWKELKAHYIIETQHPTKPQNQQSRKSDFLFGKVIGSLGFLVGLYCVAIGLLNSMAVKNAMNQTTAEIQFVGGWLIIIGSVICFMLARIGRES